MRQEIIASREASSMVSTWTEYLCLAKDANGDCRVEICQYEVLAEFENTDEHGNELEIPKEYNGREVVGVEDGYLVGGALGCADDGYFPFDAQSIDAAMEWIKEQEFDAPLSTRKILIELAV